jgi:hypothetical protein
MTTLELTEVPTRPEADEQTGGTMADGWFRCAQCDELHEEEKLPASWERLHVCSERCADAAILARDLKADADSVKMGALYLDLKAMLDVLVSRQDAPGKVGWSTGKVVSLMRRIEKW